MALNAAYILILGLCALTAQAQRAANHTSSDYVVLADQQALVRSEQKLVSFLYNYTASLESAINGIHGYIKNYSNSITARFALDGPPAAVDVDLEDELRDQKQLEMRTAQFMEFTKTLTTDFDWAYSGLVRLSDDLPELNSLIDANFEALKSVEKYFEEVETEGFMRLPEPKDLKELRTWLAQMWLMYDWTVEELEEGNFEGLLTNSGLEIEHILDIAEKMVEDNMFSAAIKLLGQLDASIKAEIMKPGADVTDAKLKFGVYVENRLDSTIRQHDFIVEKLPKELIEMNPYLQMEKIVRFEMEKHGRLSARRRVDYREIPPLFKSAGELMETQAIAMEKSPYLCSAKTRRVPPNFKCFLKSDHHPFWILAPQKTEVLNDDPLVVQVYDILPDGLVNEVKNYTFTKSFRGVVYTDNGTLGHSHARIASDYTLEVDTERWQRMSNFAEMTTGLGSMDDRMVERIKVSTYPTGGHFAPHMDALFLKEIPRQQLKDRDQTGDRTITFLYYLSDVEMGGRTAFPLLDTFAEPVKGSAVYWYNLHANCSADYRSWHLSCPTVLGNKWVAVKLIRNSLESHANGHCEADLDLVRSRTMRHDVFTGAYY